MLGKLFNIRLVKIIGVSMLVVLLSRFIKVMWVVVFFLLFRWIMNGFDVVWSMVKLLFIINCVSKNMGNMVFSVVGINNKYFMVIMLSFKFMFFW